MNALDYLILRYRLWRHTRRFTHDLTYSGTRGTSNRVEALKSILSYAPDARSKFNVTPGTEWWRSYPHLAKKKDTNPNG